MNSRVMEIEAEIEGLNKEGERVLAHLEALKAQFDRGLISRPLYEKTVEEAKARIVSIDQRLPALLGERERLEGKGAGGEARAGAAALEPPKVRPIAPADRSLPSPSDLVQKVEEALSRARAALSETNQLKPVLGTFAARVTTLEDQLKGVPLQELQTQLQQLAERQARVEAFAREMDRSTKAEFHSLADLVKPMPSALEKIQEDISTARIEIKALKYEAEALNTLQEDRVRALEEARGERKK